MMRYCIMFFCYLMINSPLFANWQADWQVYSPGENLVPYLSVKSEKIENLPTGFDKSTQLEIRILAGEPSIGELVLPFGQKFIIPDFEFVNYFDQSITLSSFAIPVITPTGLDENRAVFKSEQWLIYALNSQQLVIELPLKKGEKASRAYFNIVGLADRLPVKTNKAK